jgi:hypothetical protein
MKLGVLILSAALLAPSPAWSAPEIGRIRFESSAAIWDKDLPAHMPTDVLSDPPLPHPPSLAPLAAAILTRILDHEASKDGVVTSVRGIPEDELAARTDYLVHAFVVQYGLLSKRISDRSEIHRFSDAELFETLRAAVARAAPDAYVNLSTRFEDDDNGARLDRSRFGATLPVAWPDEEPFAISLRAGAFPQTLDEFGQAISTRIRARIDQIYSRSKLIEARQVVWQKYVQSSAPGLGASTRLLSLTSEQLPRMEAALDRELARERSRHPGAVVPPKGSPAYELELEMRIRLRETQQAWRKAAYDLFRANRFEYARGSCGAMCFSGPDSSPRVADPLQLAEALFPERLYPGMALDPAGGGPLESTLRDPTQFDRVETVETDNMALVFGLYDHD